jgi:hypothetical protein
MFKILPDEFHKLCGGVDELDPIGGRVDGLVVGPLNAGQKSARVSVPPTLLRPPLVNLKYGSKF